MNTTKTRNAVGIVLAIALLLLTLSGSGYFFFTLKVSFVQWLAFNACSPASLIYLVCLSIFWFKGKTGLLPFALLPMYYFGTMGLFTFTWSGANVFAQLSHITMTLNIVCGQPTCSIALATIKPLQKVCFGASWCLFPTSLL